MLTQAAVQEFYLNKIVKIWFKSGTIQSKRKGREEMPVFDTWWYTHIVKSIEARYLAPV